MTQFAASRLRKNPDRLPCISITCQLRRKSGAISMSTMARRGFVALLGGAAIWPSAAFAQKTGVKRVGIIMGFADDDEVWKAYLATFREALQELGWTDGSNIRFDYRFSGEDEGQMRRMATEIVGLSPDVILASTNSVVSATLNATHS